MSDEHDTEVADDSRPSEVRAGEPVCLFYSEAETAACLGIHRTTLRDLALRGQAPITPVQITAHRRIYRRIDLHRLAGIDM